MWSSFRLRKLGQMRTLAMAGRPTQDPRRVITHREESLPRGPEGTPVSPGSYTEQTPVMNIGSDALCQASNRFFLQITVVIFYLPKPTCGQVVAVPHVLPACPRPSLDGTGDRGKASDAGVRPRSKSQLSYLPAFWLAVYAGPFSCFKIISGPTC